MFWLVRVPKSAILPAVDATTAQLENEVPLAGSGASAGVLLHTGEEQSDVIAYRWRWSWGEGQ